MRSFAVARTMNLAYPGPSGCRLLQDAQCVVYRTMPAATANNRTTTRGTLCRRPEEAMAELDD
jgi:hypothetical protein